MRLATHAAGIVVPGQRSLRWNVSDWRGLLPAECNKVTQNEALFMDSAE
jgi:hypothetical protein